MIVMRCAWHPRYRGYPWIYNVDFRLGDGLVVSDGMCRPCARRWRAECRAGNVVLEADRPSPIIPGWVPRAGLGVALATAVIFAASPLDMAGMRSFPATRGAATASALPAAVAPARFEPAAAQAAGPRCAAPATARSQQPIRAVAARRPAEAPRRAAAVRTAGGEGVLCRPLHALRTVFPGLGDCRTLFARGGGASSDTFLAQAP